MKRDTVKMQDELCFELPAVMREEAEYELLLETPCRMDILIRIIVKTREHYEEQS